MPIHELGCGWRGALSIHTIVLLGRRPHEAGSRSCPWQQLPHTRRLPWCTRVRGAHLTTSTSDSDLPSGAVTFQPHRGKALLWPSVKADSPHEKDDRTHHEALPVTAGEKFGNHRKARTPH